MKKSVVDVENDEWRRIRKLLMPTFSRAKLKQVFFTIIPQKITKNGILG